MLAHATISTEKSSRHLQALCGHFSRKVQADHSSDQGHIDFGFGFCNLRADPQALVLHVEGPDMESVTRLKNVVGSHLERFAVKDSLHVEWADKALPSQA